MKTLISFLALISLAGISSAQEVVKVERKIERNIAKYNYTATLDYDGNRWTLSSCNHPESVDQEKDIPLKYDHLIEWDKMSRRFEAIPEAEIPFMTGVYSKFLEWHRVAAVDHSPTFSKEIAKLDYTSYEFQWDGAKARLNFYLDAVEVGLFHELLSSVDVMRKEWATKRAASEKAKELFK